MTITDHILVVISFRQAVHYNKALWSKNFFPPWLSRPWQLTMLKEVQGPFSCHWRNFWHGLWLFVKVTFWKTAITCIAANSLTDSAFKPWTTTKMAISNMILFFLCPVEGELKRHAYLCICVSAVPMCNVCVVHVWHQGWDGYGNVDFFCTVVGHALDVVTDKNTDTATVRTQAHTLITSVYGNSCLETKHNKTVLDCVWVSKQTCTKLVKQIATKFSLVWLTCCLAMELINVASMKGRSITIDSGWMLPKAKDCRVTIKLNIRWRMCVCACMWECVCTDVCTHFTSVSVCVVLFYEVIGSQLHSQSMT